MESVQFTEEQKTAVKSEILRIVKLLVTDKNAKSIIIQSNDCSVKWSLNFAFTNVDKIADDKKFPVYGDAAFLYFAKETNNMLTRDLLGYLLVTLESLTGYPLEYVNVCNGNSATGAVIITNGPYCTVITNDNESQEAEIVLN